MDARRSSSGVDLIEEVSTDGFFGEVVGVAKAGYEGFCWAWWEAAL